MKQIDVRLAPEIVALEACHRTEIAAHLLRLSGEDRYLRFGARGVGDATVREHADSIDFDRDAVLGIRGTDGTLVAIAEVLRCGRAAEVAFSVDAAFRGCGFAGALLAAGIETARRLGAVQVLAQFVSDNRAMRRVFERSGFAIEREDGEYLASLPLPEDLRKAA